MSLADQVRAASLSTPRRHIIEWGGICRAAQFRGQRLPPGQRWQEWPRALRKSVGNAVERLRGTLPSNDIVSDESNCTDVSEGVWRLYRRVTVIERATKA